MLTWFLGCCVLFLLFRLLAECDRRSCGRQRDGRRARSVAHHQLLADGDSAVGHAGSHRLWHARSRAAAFELYRRVWSAVPDGGGCAAGDRRPAAPRAAERRRVDWPVLQRLPRGLRRRMEVSDADGHTVHGGQCSSEQPAEDKGNSCQSDGNCCGSLAASVCCLAISSLVSGR